MADQKSNGEFDLKKLPETLPILPLFDTVLFPKMVLPLVVMQKESVQLIDEAMSKDRIIGLLVSRTPSGEETAGTEDLYEIGTSALILKMAKTEDEKSQILVQGLGRFKTTAFLKDKPYQIRVESVTSREDFLGQIQHLVFAHPYSTLLIGKPFHRKN